MNSELTLIEKAFFLKKTELFSELDLDLLLAIADKADVLSFQNGEEIFCVSQDAHRIYLIIQGKVRIHDHDESFIQKVLPQDYFGDEALFNALPRAYAAFAEGVTQVMTITRTHLTEIILECPQVALSLLRAYSAVTPYRKRKREESE
jgi:CRP-like cAMP-binding protein